MLYWKEDWNEAKERMATWWDGEVYDRPAIQAIAPKHKHVPDNSWNWEFARNPSNPDRTIDLYENWCSHIYFGGEAYPNLWVNLGAGILGAYLGATPKFGRDTVWFGGQWSKGYVKDWDELLTIEFDEQNTWWKYTKRITRRAVKRGRDRFVVGMTDLGGIADVIASLRSPKNLLVDLYRRKDEVRTLSQKIVEIWHRCYEELHKIIQEGMSGSSAWMGIWSPRRWYPIQCDFAAMLSPKLFDELVLPYLREQCKRLDDPIYHLDGPDQLCHVDSLLTIPELKGIQWVPGAKEENLGNHCGSRKWYPLYRKILSKRKLLVLSLPPNTIRPIVRELAPKGILFQTTAASTLAAKLLLKTQSR